MNFIFHEKLDEFVIIYIDDILVYSKIVEEHMKHLEYLLNKLLKNQLFANKAKNEFAQKEMGFLGHILSGEGVRPNLKKLEAIKDWKRLITIKGIRSFLGLVNFYRKFIKGFSQLVKPLLDLLKKEFSFRWKEKQQRIFEDLKDKLSSIPMLRFPDFIKPFEVHSNASDFVIGGVHPRWTPNCLLEQEVL